MRHDFAHSNLRDRASAVREFPNAGGRPQPWAPAGTPCQSRLAAVSVSRAFRAAIRSEMNPTLDLASTSAALYLDLIERCLTNTIYGDGYTDWHAPGVERPYNSSLRETGRDWPKRAHTMIGGVRLRNLREL